MMVESNDLLVKDKSQIRVRQEGRFYFSMFLLAQFISLIRVFLFSYIDFAYLGLVISGLAVGSLLFLFLSIRAYTDYSGRSWRQNLGSKIVRWLILFVVAILWLTFYGAIRKNDFGYVVYDFFIYLMILGCIILGSFQEFWSDINKPLLFFFFAAFIVSLLSFPTVISGVSWFAVSARVGVVSLGYEVKEALNLWPLLLLTARMQKRSVQLLIFGVIMFIGIQNILFQKRFPIVFLAIYCVVFLALPVIWKLNKVPFRGSNEVVMFTFIGIALVIAFILVPIVMPAWWFQGQLVALQERYLDVSYGGPLKEIFVTNERYQEISYMLKSFRFSDYLTGRGFGGYFLISPIDPVPQGIWLSDAGYYGRRELHIGAFMLLLKGGLPLMLIYFWGVVQALRAWRPCFKSYLGTAAYFVIVMDVVHLLQAGGFIFTDSFRITIVSLCIGYCISIKVSSEKKNNT